MVFKFRYEALLGYRNHLKEKSELEYSLARQQLRRLKDEHKEYQERLYASRNDLNNSIREKTDSNIIKNCSQYIGALKIWIAVKEAEVAKAEKLTAEKLEDLLNKTKKYKIIEKLKERDFQKWKNRLNMEEKKQTNEVAVLRHGRDFL